MSVRILIGDCREISPAAGNLLKRLREQHEAHNAFCADLYQIADPVERAWAVRIACEPAANNARGQQYFTAKFFHPRMVRA